MPYEQRIRNIRKGLKTKKIEINENDEEISKRIVQMINKSENLCICSGFVGEMQFSYINFFYVIEEILENR